MKEIARIFELKVNLGEHSSDKVRKLVQKLEEKGYAVRKPIPREDFTQEIFQKDGPYLGRINDYDSRMFAKVRVHTNIPQGRKLADYISGLDL